MPKYKVTENDKGLQIKIEDLDGRKDQLLSVFQECRQGTCACPTAEYKKLESMDLDHQGEEIQIQLNARAGQIFNKDEIERCLDHTTQEIEKGE